MRSESSMNIKRKNKEIGSEFYNCTVALGKKESTNLNTIDWGMYLSGRTALYGIIEDIKDKRKVSKAYLPSYICESMIRPFEDSNIKIEFYDVLFTDEGCEYCLEPNKQVDIILIMNYFGLCNNKYDSDLKKIVKKYSDSIIIEDITHSLLSKKDFSDADYVYGSIRKWDGFYSGGIAYSNKNNFINKQMLMDDNNFHAIRKKGMQKKKQYIEQSKYLDKTFLYEFEKAEEILEQDFKYMRIDSLSREMFYHWNEESIREKRKKNYRFLLNEYDVFKKVGAHPIYMEMNNEDVPLFMPLIFDDERQRNKVRQILIDNQVYCPIHWPIYDSLKKIDCISPYELSIPCDQRYDEENMKYIINILKDKVK